jgi:hypothetical protein
LEIFGIDAIRILWYILTKETPAMQNLEQHQLSRVEEPTFFRAPSNFVDCCMDCGNAILPGEIIAEVGDSDYIHESCIEAAWEN